MPAAQGIAASLKFLIATLSRLHAGFGFGHTSRTSPSVTLPERERRLCDDSRRNTAGPAVESPCVAGDPRLSAGSNRLRQLFLRACRHHDRHEPAHVEFAAVAPTGDQA